MSNSAIVALAAFLFSATYMFARNHDRFGRALPFAATAVGALNALALYGALHAVRVGQ